jgi:hypothetical protein
MKAGLSVRTIAAGTGIPVGSVHRAIRANARAHAKLEVAVLKIMDKLLNKGLQRKAKSAHASKNRNASRNARASPNVISLKRTQRWTHTVA